MNPPISPQIAYFSMEFALDARIPNYAGGLGVLAADMMQSCADLDMPAIGVSLIYHQDDIPEKAFHPEEFMECLTETVEVTIENRTVRVGAFRYDCKGRDGAVVPIYFLTTNLPENKRWDRDLTKWLYASDQYTRIGQEAILGIGGVRMLKKLGFAIEHFHMNEGHSAFLTLELLREYNYHDEEVRKRCTFTTHTPIAAGHDYFDYKLCQQILGDMIPWHIRKLATDKALSMTHLAIHLSKKVNSVSEKHSEVCGSMFPGVPFENVTNGVNHLRWVSAPMAKLFDSTLPKWRENPEVFTDAVKNIDGKKLLAAHAKNKKELIAWVNKHAEFFPYDSKLQAADLFDDKTLTIAFARRFVPYKRPDLIFHDLKKLRELGYRKIQLIFAGHCHPDDQFCNWKRGDLTKYARELRGQIRVALLPDYNVDIAKILISGADIWLNNPVVPQEASGTSGMKAALNGTLNLSILDGWWIEGFSKNSQAGWGFPGETGNLGEKTRDDLDARGLYTQLEAAIACYYSDSEEWSERMKAAISLLAQFNTERTVREYEEKMWRGVEN